jgi:serine/threonine protein phosphatase PrpC
VHPFRSAVTRSINATDRCDPDLVLLDLQPGDRLLLCSDGLTDLVPGDHLAAVLAGVTREAAVQALIRSALRAGGHDNITCIIGDIDPGVLAPESRWPYHCRLHGAVGNPTNLIDPAAPYRAA